MPTIRVKFRRSSKTECFHFHVNASDWELQIGEHTAKKDMIIVGESLDGMHTPSVRNQFDDRTIFGLRTHFVCVSFSNDMDHDAMRILFAYHFFGFLWTNQLIHAISMCTIAGAICRYYWSRNKNATEMGRFPILYSFKNCLRYHFGSLAYGSFIIAVVQFVRAILMYIDHQTQGVQKSNLVVKVAMKAVQCCMWCLEKCLKFLSKNAYIMVAMNGTGFCTSAKDAFKILLSNLAQVGTVSMATFLLLSAGKLAITMACTITMFAYIESKPEEFGIGARHEIASPMAPVLLTMVLAWFVASTFLGVYEMAIDTILLCFCQDKAHNSDTGAYFMSDSLRKFIDSVPVSTSHNNSNGSAPPAAQVHAGG